MLKKEIKILKAKEEDIYKIVKIHKKCVLETNANFYSVKAISEWLGQISKENVKNQFNSTSWYILVSGNKTVGFCQFSLDEKELYQINIDPVFQNTGLGKILYDFIEQKFIKEDKKEVFLNSTLNAVDFYKKLGFKSLKKIKFKLDKQNIKMIQMKKRLTKRH